MLKGLPFNTHTPILLAIWKIRPSHRAQCGTMFAATRSWYRRNRKTLAIAAGVISIGYVAGQYALNKIQEARQRMSEDRIAKEKYGRVPMEGARQKNKADALRPASDADSNKIRKTAPTLSWRSCLPFVTKSSQRCPSSRSPNSCRKSDRRGCTDWEHPKLHLQNIRPHHPVPRMMQVCRAVLSYMPARSLAAMDSPMYLTPAPRGVRRNYGKR